MANYLYTQLVVVEERNIFFEYFSCFVFCMRLLIKRRQVDLSGHFGYDLQYSKSGFNL